MIEDVQKLKKKKHNMNRTINKTSNKKIRTEKLGSHKRKKKTH